MRNFALAAFAAALLIGGAAEASHNRGSTLIPSVDGSGNLTIEATSFWRPTFVSQVTSVTIVTPGGTTVSTGLTQVGMNDTSDSRFTRTDTTGSIDISSYGAGTYEISWGSCCRVSGIPNATSNMGTTSTIFWDGSSATSPITFDIQNIQPNVVRGTAYSDNLGATSANGDTLSYDDTVLTVDITSQAPGYTIDPTGQINIPAADTAAYADNASNVGADVAFSGEIIATDSSGQQTGTVQFDWLFDAVATGSNTVPTVSDVVINATVGDLINQAGPTGTDPNGDIVTLSFLGLNGPGGAVGNAMFSSTAGDPATSTFSWDTAGFAAGTYIASVSGTDGSLSDQGLITVNLAAAPVSTIPLPAGMLLLGSGLIGLCLVGRRRRT